MTALLFSPFGGKPKRVEIATANFDQLKMDFALWNRGAASQLIEQECGISMAISTGVVGHYLKRCGFIPRKSRFSCIRATPGGRGAMAERKSIQRLLSALELKAGKFTGPMRQHWATRLCEDVVLHPRERRR